jgi:hypothetical protein
MCLRVDPELRGPAQASMSEGQSIAKINRLQSLTRIKVGQEKPESPTYANPAAPSKVKPGRTYYGSLNHQTNRSERI